MNDFINDSMSDEEAKRRQQLREIRQKRIEQQKRDRRQAIIFLVAIAVVIIAGIAVIVNLSNKNEENQIQSDQSSYLNQTVESKDSSNDAITETTHTIKEIDGITYVDGIIIANKTYSLPESYDPGLNSEAFEAFNELIAGASKDGLKIYLCSGYRSYQDQYQLYNKYAQERGTAAADEVSARPGFSEHQTGLAIDVNYTEFSFADTEEGKWLAEHCSEYGFIIRFPKGKEKQTGFEYEPWHIRYVGVDTAKKITESGLCLEEYLGITSEYKD